MMYYVFILFFFSSRRRHTRYIGDWSSDVCSSDLMINGNRGMEALMPCSFPAVSGGMKGTWSTRREKREKIESEIVGRSEERRVGKECRARRWRKEKKKKIKTERNMRRHAKINKQS